MNKVFLSPLTGDSIDFFPIILAVAAAVAIIAVLFFLRKK
jgi:LPXTG-motif cell wall-anchored protein